ncbi:hypothetical protein [uncultured Tessaracoccus sp.]|uniref:hypothetical protein n=1 Tax=uncultured Tessaracoccus sp. TaxID=905023 RepID=UPI002620BF6C|nr:hypothetical protein [uncultured Tessaracoccus sp.]
MHHELVDADADSIRRHLHACERCMEKFEIESTINEMIRRSTATKAPESLTIRVRSLRITRR